MTFRIQALTLAPFQPLFDLDDDALFARGARRMVADAPNSAPCRVSLRDADVGDRLILLNHRHLDDPTSPYRATGPIFVREAALETAPDIGVVPAMLSSRLLSIRAYDAAWMMTDADVVEGAALASRLSEWFDKASTARIHLHTARRGCYMAAAVRT